MTDSEITKTARRLKLPKFMYDTPDARRGLARFAAAQVPTNWLHPLLTGPRAVFNGDLNAHANVQNVLKALHDSLAPQDSAPK